MFHKQVGNRYVFAGVACSAFLLQQLAYLLFFSHAECALLLVSVSFTWQETLHLQRRKNHQATDGKEETIVISTYIYGSSRGGQSP